MATTSFVCIKCHNPFDTDSPRGYCDACVKGFRDMQSKISNAQHPFPGLYLDGVFVDGKECPATVWDSKRRICGLCGSTEIEPGYGLTGHGMGSYNFCMGCNTFLDFQEDCEE